MNFEGAVPVGIFAPVKNYFKDIWEISVHPGRFFSADRPKGGISYPLAFALVTHWLGEAVGFIWRSIIGGSLAEHMGGIFKIAEDVVDVDSPGRGIVLSQVREQLTHWAWGAGKVVADPFITIVSILFTAFFVYIGARILVRPDKGSGLYEIDFETALKIVCFGMAPAIFAALPLVGGVISSLWVAGVTIIGAKTVYRTGWSRAVAVALFPKLLFLGIILTGLFMLAVALLKLVATVL